MRSGITGENGFIGSALRQKVLLPEGVMFHLGALVRNDHSIRDPRLTIKTNALWSAEIFHRATQGGYPVVYTSSAVVYSPVRTPYQISKIAADSLAQWYNENGGDIRIMRLAEVYGPGMKNGPIAAWREQYRKNGVIDVWDGSAKKDYIYISDAVVALIQAVSLPAGVYDVCSGVQTELVDFAKLLGVPYRIVPPLREVAKELPQTPHASFTMKVSLAEGMAEVRKEFA